MGKVWSRLFAHELQNEPKKTYQPSEHDKTMSQLKILRDELYSKKKQINKNITKCEEEIKDLLSKNQKTRAINALKRKKLFEEYIQTVDNKYLFINKAIMEVEKAEFDQNLNKVMKDTNNLLKDIEKSIDLNVMEEYMENSEKENIRQNNFNELFEKYNVSKKNEIDEEYNKYEAEIFKEKFVNIPKANVNLKQMDVEKNEKSNEKNKYNLLRQLDALT